MFWEYYEGEKMTKKKNTILVCDDDKEIVDAIEIYLSQEGYRILKAYGSMRENAISKGRRRETTNYVR